MARSGNNRIYAIVAGVFIVGVLSGLGISSAWHRNTPAATAAPATTSDDSGDDDATTSTSSFLSSLSQLTTPAPAATSDTSASGGGATTQATGVPVDVELNDCLIPDNPTQGAQADITVTNKSAGTYSFKVFVSFDSADGTRQLDSDYAFVESLSAGQSTRTQVYSLQTSLRSQQLTCRVGNVTSYES